MNLNVRKAVLAGVIGTAAMTFVGAIVAPMMGMPRMNPAEMLAGQMGGNLVVGWLAHFMIGAMLALIYAALAPSLKGAPWLRGATYALAPWLLQQLAVMPMMGAPMFSGSMALAGGSLVGHLIYGAVVGTIYGEPAGSAPTARA